MSVAVVGGSMVLAGCGGGSDAASPAANHPKTVVVTKTEHAAAAPTGADAEPTAEDSAMTGAAASDAGPTDPDAADTTDADTDASSGPPVLQATGGKRTLALADAFSAEDWEEGSYTPAGSADPVQGIRTQVYCDQSSPLELRFGQATGTLHVSFAQDISSESSDETVEFDLTVDGRTVKSKNVSFKQSGEMTTPLSGVASVQISAQDTGDECDSSTLPLITKLWITAK